MTETAPVRGADSYALASESGDALAVSGQQALDFRHPHRPQAKGRPADGQREFRYASGWGTFRDSMRAPIHGWFAYPAGFSYQAVAHGMRLHKVAQPGMTVYDPFMGTGTTNVVAKTQGINSVGVEAHPFVYGIARAKMSWELDVGQVQQALAEVVKAARAAQSSSMSSEMPALVVKCFTPRVLADLLSLRDSVEAHAEGMVRFFLRTALTSVLRRVSSVQTGWPYIAPNKPRKISGDLCAIKTFAARVEAMLADIHAVRSQAHPDWKQATHHLHHADSRDTSQLIDPESADFIFTSPPYLNNYDYADRTRMEMYFFGEASNWRDITEGVRNRLMTAATTQVSRRDQWQLSAGLQSDCPAVHAFLSGAIDRLSELRLMRGGKKDYDIVVCGYFNDIHRVLHDSHRVLRAGSQAVFVLGDSAPYGVHIPTDELVGEIAKGVGFKSYALEVLRKRGDKWKHNPQRHGTALRESVVTLRKAR